MQDIVNFINNNTTSGEKIMDLGIPYLLNILKRLVACKVKDCVLVNGVFLAAYDTDDDNDESGFNHFIFSVDSGSFYTDVKYINVDQIYNKMKTDDKEIEDLRKERKIKPSDKSTSIKFVNDCLMVSYSLCDEFIKSYTYNMPKPSKKVENLISGMVTKMFNMFCGDHVYISEDYESLMEIIENSPRTLMRKVKVGERIVEYPFMKSNLFRLTKPDFIKSYIGDVNLAKITNSSNEDVILGEVYSHSLIMAKNKILEIHSAYMVNYL